MKTLFTTSAICLLMAACSQSNSPAGSQLDTGNFGAATMNNSLIQSGDANYTINLARRFAEEVNSTITFPFNSAALDETARTTLRQQATWINQFPEVRFKVFGHTDLVGSQSYNRALGLRRAQAAVIFLTSQGIGKSRLEAVVSFGETQPVIVTGSAERRNRRTVTEVSGFVNSHPMVLNGKYAEVVFREYVASATPVATVAAATAE